MKVELHCHTNRYSPCAASTPAEVMERMMQLGYEAVYITEHNAVWSDAELAQLRTGFPAIRIFPGVELSVGDDFMLHVVVLGTNDPVYVKMRDPEDVFRRAADHGHLAILAHPFRWGGAMELLEAGIMPHALEFATPNHSHDEQLDKTATAERSFNIPIVNAGDIHSTTMLGRFWIETDAPIRQATDIRRVVLNGHYVNCADT